ncbi:hypothetical protein [Streptomyces griseoluteus]|uniref:hypothetical protein n=1 Tax=Streptomyces griseoluteus TaxID=29306 RepID=UPI003442BB8D
MTAPARRTRVSAHPGWRAALASAATTGTAVPDASGAGPVSVRSLLPCRGAGLRR